MIYTSTYRYSGADRIDITVKGNDPYFKLFAPTWQMVMDFKNGRLSQEAYTRQYYDLVNQRIRHDHSPGAFLHQTFLELGRFTLVCFCKPGDFCHRVVLANWLSRDWAIPYGGEIPAY